MPQLDISTYASQLFWLFVCFSSTYISMRYWLIPRIESIQDNRTKRITHDLEKARMCQKTTELLLQEYEDILKTAKEKASAIITETHEKSQIERLELEYEIGSWIKTELKIIEKKLDKEREICKEDIREAVEEITKTLLEKMKTDQKSFKLEDIIEKKVIHG